MNKYDIAIGADHGGFELKEKITAFLEKNGYNFKDFGVFNADSVDYPAIAHEVAREVANKNCSRGILICGSGLGMAIAANKISGIRAVTCHDTYSARMSRAHNDANILTLGARVVGVDLAADVIKVWLESEFEGGRHQKRVDMIEKF